jgi:electron transfer flavoprotein alpha subunit
MGGMTQVWARIEHNHGLLRKLAQQAVNHHLRGDVAAVDAVIAEAMTVLNGPGSMYMFAAALARHALGPATGAVRPSHAPAAGTTGDELADRVVNAVASRQIRELRIVFEQYDTLTQVHAMYRALVAYAAQAHRRPTAPLTATGAATAETASAGRGGFANGRWHVEPGGESGGVQVLRGVAIRGIR